MVLRTPERRLSPRFKVRTPLAFHRMGPRFDGESVARSINISTEGVYFATHLSLAIGERIELALHVPKRISGTESKYCRFTARVAHVNLNMPEGLSGIGVQLLCYETPLDESRRAVAA